VSRRKSTRLERWLDDLETQLHDEHFPDDVPTLENDADLLRLGDAGHYVSLTMVQTVRKYETGTRFPISLIQPRPGENHIAWINRVSLALAPYYTRRAS